MIGHKEKIEKGGEAQKLIDNPILKEAFQTAKNAAMEAFILSDPDDVELREHQYLVLKALNAVEQSLKGFIREGERSKLQLTKTSAEKLHKLD